jgi:cobalt-zinc-cadmium efflux system protein
MSSDAHGSHDHDHTGHHHGIAPGQSFGTAFAVGVGLNGAFVVLEALYGVLSGSIALIADAGHNLGDVLALALSWAAVHFARRAPSARFTYGLRRGTILAALVNALVMLVGVGAILVEGIRLLIAPEPVNGLTVTVVAAIGIGVNGVSAYLFAAGRKGELNVRAAFLHLAYDALVSAGVVVAGLLILATGWLRIDPLMSLVIAGVMLAGTWGLMRNSVGMAMDMVPDSIDADAVASWLADLPGVAAVHDLHIWGMSTSETALTCHLVIPSGHPGDLFLVETARDLRDRFRIAHATLQIEAGTEVCALAPADTV